MRFDLLTLFPEMVEGPLGASLMRRAREAGHVDINVHDLRAWASGKHRHADDTPYGGGAGMVLKIEPMVRALEAVKLKNPQAKIVLMGPAGVPFQQSRAHELAKEEGLILLCGHYEGVDDRIRHFVDEEISIGDYVLTGGELPALVVIDAVARLCPGVVGNEHSLEEESFETGLLDHPHFTRPREFEGLNVPETLLSGNHRLIKRWRRERAIERTWRLRPELLACAHLSKEDLVFLETLRGTSPPNDD